MSMPATRHRFTLDAWHRMIEAGVFQDDERVELLDGEIYEMTPTDPAHQSVVDRLARLSITRLGTRAIDRVEVHRSPAGSSYRTVRIVRRGESLACLAFPDDVPVVDEILG